MDETQASILDLIQSAIDLANSVRDDLREQRSISNETVLFLNSFKVKHDNLSNLLDIANGIN